MPITTGSVPKALVAGVRPNVETGPDSEPLSAVADRFVPKPRKPPKIKKRAFGAKEPGAAFRK